MKITSMTIKDFEAIENILQLEFDEFWNANILKNELENQNSKYIVAKENEEIVRVCWNFNFARYCRGYEYCCKEDKKKNGNRRNFIKRAYSNG